jgi:MFS family permease
VDSLNPPLGGRHSNRKGCIVRKACEAQAYEKQVRIKQSEVRSMDPATSFSGFTAGLCQQAVSLYRRVARAVSSNASFRYFLFSDGLMLFGSCFYQIILPGLVMEITGSTRVIAAAILLAGVARIGLMLPGGMLSDTFSPKRLILIASMLRLCILIALIGMIALGWINAAAILGISFAFGAAEAIVLPARGVLSRWLAQEGQLLKANSMVLGQEKIIGLAGPAAAGIIFTSLSKSAGLELSGSNFTGEVCALVIQGLVTGASILLLLRTKAARPLLHGAQPGAHAAPDGSLKELALLIIHQKSLRKPVLTVFAINAFSIGPLYIGLPILAAKRFADVAGVLGFLMSASGCGALLGTILSRLLPNHRPRSVDRMLVIAMSLLGAGLVGLFAARSVVLAAMAVIVIGAAASFVHLSAVTSIQLETPPRLLGRMMGLLNLK